jgi:hypothetical protein
MKFKRMGKLLVITLALILLITSVNFSASASNPSVPPLKPEPFKIGILDPSIGDTSVGASITKAIQSADQSIELLSTDIRNIPEDIDTIWVSIKHINEVNVKELFNQAKSNGKPFYVYGDGLDIKEVSSVLGAEIDLEARFGSEDGETQIDSINSFDMVGYKFENEKIIPSFVLSINKGNRPYDFEGLKKHARYYDIRIREGEQKGTLFGLFSPKVAEAAGMNVSLPSSYSQVYVWDVTVYNWMEISGAYKRASTYHVYEVYKDPTTSNPDYKSFSTFRMDAVHLDRFDTFYSRNVLYAQYGGVITKNYEPENSTFNGSTTLNLGWPMSGSVTFSSQDPIEVYSSSIDWANDKHSFYVEDNEWMDHVLRPGDVWVANLGYHIPENASWHEFGNYISHQKEGTWGSASPSEYSSGMSAYRTSGSYVYWRLTR